MATVPDLLKNTIKLHCRGKHRNAILSLVVYSGDFGLADAMGRRLNHKNNVKRLDDNVAKNNAILDKLRAMK